jgi:hypothetical protein
MVLADSDRIARVPSYLGNPLGLIHFRVRGYHALWPVFPDGSASITGPTVAPQPQTLFRESGLGYFFPVRSPLLRESLIVFFSSGY